MKLKLKSTKQRSKKRHPSKQKSKKGPMAMLRKLEQVRKHFFLYRQKCNNNKITQSSDRGELGGERGKLKEAKFKKTQFSILQSHFITKKLYSQSHNTAKLSSKSREHSIQTVNVANQSKIIIDIDGITKLRRHSIPLF